MNNLETLATQTVARPCQNAWRLTVVDALDLTPGTRRVRLVSELDGFVYTSGQPLLLKLPRRGGESALSDYRVCAFDAEEERLEVDFVLRGDNPATRWVRAASHGDCLIAESPQF
jgi:NADPH-dependent ferric siderophore reductase